ncbi:MAG: hypothetical protein QS721_08350 [Candidatus Endonucleobacter sp. (ex Gigantidas childressi)]|nr:hypothetical protein [Candidatus Endonucleobacter sp. (ex Gigantidas childressi)]
MSIKKALIYTFTIGTACVFFEGQHVLAVISGAVSKKPDIDFLSVSACFVVAMDSIAFLAFPRSIKILPASQYSCPNKGTHFKLFFPMLTMRFGTYAETVNQSKLL